MLDTIKARREELLKNHEQLVKQQEQVTVALERTRGAIAMCDELLAAAQNGADPDALPADDEQKADTYA
jgi:hypothetical protein